VIYVTRGTKFDYENEDFIDAIYHVAKNLGEYKMILVMG